MDNISDIINKNIILIITILLIFMMLFRNKLFILIVYLHNVIICDEDRSVIYHYASEWNWS